MSLTRSFDKEHGSNTDENIEMTGSKKIQFQAKIPKGKQVLKPDEEGDEEEEEKKSSEHAEKSADSGDDSSESGSDDEASSDDAGDESSNSETVVLTARTAHRKSKKKGKKEAKDTPTPIPRVVLTVLTHDNLKKVYDNRMHLKANGYHTRLARHVAPSMMHTISVLHLSLMIDAQKPGDPKPVMLPIRPMYKWITDNETIFFEMMNDNVPKNNVSKDTLTELKNAPVILIPGDPGCVLRWDQLLCKEIEHIRSRVTSEDLSILLAYWKHHLITVENQKHLSDKVVGLLNAGLFPSVPLKFDNLSEFVAKLHQLWSKLHKLWMEFDKSGLLEIAQRDASHDRGGGGKPKGKRSAKPDTIDAGHKKARHDKDGKPHSKRDPRCDTCGNLPSMLKLAKVCNPGSWCAFFKHPDSNHAKVAWAESDIGKAYVKASKDSKEKHFWLTEDIKLVKGKFVPRPVKQHTIDSIQVDNINILNSIQVNNPSPYPKPAVNCRTLDGATYIAVLDTGSVGSILANYISSETVSALSK